jgi:hypothetical protein
LSGLVLRRLRIFRCRGGHRDWGNAVDGREHGRS